MNVSIGLHDGTDTPGMQYHLASSAEWSVFIAWADALPDADAPCIKALVIHGHCNETAELVKELENLVDKGLPAEVDPTARKMLDIIGEGDVNETATILG